MALYEKASLYLESFLKDLSGGEDFVYEITCCTPKSNFVTTYRSKDLYLVMKKMEVHAPTRNIFISPFNTQYPEGSCDFVYGRKMKSSNSVIIDIDSKEGVVDHRVVMSKLRDAGIQKPTYLITSGRGCHLWYMFTSHIGQSRLRDIYEKIRNKIVSIEWPETWRIDDLSIRQQFRVPFSVNHKYDKLVMLVDRGDKIEIPKQKFKMQETFTKKELKRHRKIKREAKPKTKTKVSKINVDESSKNRFLEGSKSIDITIKQEVDVSKSKLKRILQLLEYGKSYLSCRIAGEALGISYKAAAKFLKKCVAYGYLKIFNDNNSAYSYEINVEYESKKKESNGRCPISGPGQSNKAMCRLARQVYKYGLNVAETVKLWIDRYYHLTSGEHLPGELVSTYESVYEKFANGQYEIFGAT